MKVHIVFAGAYSDRHIVRVFLDEALAKTNVDQKNAGEPRYGDDVDIETWETDDALPGLIEVFEISADVVAGGIVTPSAYAIRPEGWEPSVRTHIIEADGRSENQLPQAKGHIDDYYQEPRNAYTPRHLSVSVQGKDREAVLKVWSEKLFLAQETMKDIPPPKPRKPYTPQKLSKPLKRERKRSAKGSSEGLVY